MRAHCRPRRRPAAASAASGPRERRGRWPSRGCPVALAADVADLGVAVHGADRHQVDHRIGAALVAELEVRTAAKRVVGARVDADAAEDAAALVDVVLLQHARLGHQRAGRARLRAAAAGDARRGVEAHVERRRDQRVEAGPHEVVAGGADDLLAHVGAATAVDAARGLAQDERVRVVADVVVVDAREAVLVDAAVAEAAALGLERPERRPVLDALAAQVAVADRLAGALQAAAGLGHRLGLRVGDLVLDVARVAHLGGHRLQPKARLLHLTGERHDREELGLRLRQRLAGADRLEVLALEERVDGIGRAPTLGDRLDDGRGADAHVAGAEDAGAAGREGDRIGGEPVAGGGDAIRATVAATTARALADGQQHAVAVDHELGARHRLRPAASGGIRRAEASCAGTRRR